MSENPIERFREFAERNPSVAGCMVQCALSLKHQGHGRYSAAKIILFAEVDAHTRGSKLVDLPNSAASIPLWLRDGLVDYATRMHPELVGFFMVTGASKRKDRLLSRKASEAKS